MHLTSWHRIQRRFPVRSLNASLQLSYLLRLGSGIPFLQHYPAALAAAGTHREQGAVCSSHTANQHLLDRKPRDSQAFRLSFVSLFHNCTDLKTFHEISSNARKISGESGWQHFSDVKNNVPHQANSKQTQIMQQNALFLYNK